MEKPVCDPHSLMEPQGYNQPNPDCGKSYRTNEPVSSVTQQLNAMKKRWREEWERFRLKEMKEIYQPDVMCGTSLDHDITNWW